MPIDYGTNDIHTDGYITSKFRREIPTLLTITTAQIDDWDLSGGSLFIVDLSSANISTYLSVTGILAGEEGEIKTIITVTSGKTINFYGDNEASQTNNRFDFSQTGGYDRGAISFIYLQNKWRNFHGTSDLKGTNSLGSVGGGGV